LDRILRKLGRPGDRLREYRDYLGLTLEEIEERYGVKGSTWSYAETEGKGISSKILDALRKGEPPAGRTRVSLTWLMEGLGEMLEEGNAADLAPAYVTPTLPGEHAAQAWEILHEAARAGGADIMAMDVKAVGEILGAIADAVATGRGEEARLRAVRRAETILRAMGKAAAP
jgi:transcriptional regulator with XRE-family HTH domain